MAQHTLRVLLHHPAVQALVASTRAFHLVGGVLRDRLLGLPSHDIDAVVAGGGEQLAADLALRLRARLVPLGGKEFAAYRLVGAGFELDLWDRGAMSLEDDLARRDFTVNSFAWSPLDGSLSDPFGGLADLELRLLVPTTEESFRGDPLRILRLPRLALQLPGFAASPAALTLARQAAPRLVEVSAERVRDELARIVAHPDAGRGVALLAALDLYPGLWLGQPGEPGSPASAGAAVSALAALDSWARRHSTELPLPTLRWTVLFTALGGTEELTRIRIERFQQSGYLNRRTAQEILRLLDLALAWRRPPASEVERRRFLYAAGSGWLAVAGLTALRDDSWDRRLQEIHRLVEREGNDLFDPPRLLTGIEVQELLGLPPGPAVGRALAAVRTAQVEGRIRTREEAVKALTALP
jgi:poly(A) polymerase